MIKKYYELTRWEQVRHGKDILTFHRMDGSYCQFRNEEWMTLIGNYGAYELGEDGIYNPIQEKQ